MIRWSAIVLIWILLSTAAALGQTTAFSYQGQLTNAGQPASGSYDLRFILFGVASGGAQLGTTQTDSAVPVSNGVFTVQLDFGASAFPGANRYLEIGVRPAGMGSYTTLAPRQQISSTPYAIRTLNATSADALSSACVSCVNDAQIGSVAGSKVTGAIPAASVPTGSGNYVQNTTAPQPSSNFNISGSGTVGGNLTVNGTLNANVSGNFIQNRTTPQSNANFDVSGNGTVGQTLTASSVGIGTGAPVSPLDVTGTGWFQGDSTPLVGGGKGTGIGFNNTIGGYLFAYDYGTGTPQNLLLNNPGGNVGIGTIAPAAGLDVQSSGRTDGIHGASPSGSGVVGGSNTGWGVYGQTGATHTTSVSGVYGNSSGDGGVGVVGEADFGNAWGVFGVSGSPTGVGVVGKAPAGGVGVSGSAAGGGWAMAASGNTTQTLASGGWVKAMVHVQSNGTVDRCYNSQASQPPAGRCPADSIICEGICAYTFGGDVPGQYSIDFGFPVADRFFSVFVGPSSGDSIVANSTGFGSDPNILDVITFYSSAHGGSTTYASFYLIVF